MRKLTGHLVYLAVHEIRDSLDLARDYRVCHVPGSLASDETWTDRSEAEDSQLDIEVAGIEPTPCMPECEATPGVEDRTATLLR